MHMRGAINRSKQPSLPTIATNTNTHYYYYTNSGNDNNSKESPPACPTPLNIQHTAQPLITTTAYQVSCATTNPTPTTTTTMTTMTTATHNRYLNLLAPHPDDIYTRTITSITHRQQAVCRYHCRCTIHTYTNITATYDFLNHRHQQYNTRPTPSPYPT